MATTYYSTDEDLRKIRPNITDLGVGSWETQHLEAFAIINRTLISRWYKDTSRAFGVDWRLTEFDADLVDITQLVRLSSYKTLELAYEYLTKDSADADGFDRHRKLYAVKYVQELKEVLAIGVNYDWDESGAVTEEEKYQPVARRIYRA